MQPELMRLSLIAEGTSAAWLFAAGGVSLLALGLYGVLSARRAQRKSPVSVALLGAALLLLVTAYFRRQQALPQVDLTLTSSGAALMLAAVTGWMLVVGLAGRAGVPREAASSAVFVGGLAGLLIARWSFLLVNPEAATHWAAWLSVRGGGLLGYPGLLGGLGVAALWLGYTLPPGNVWSWLDAAAPAAALGAAIASAGCYIFGCDYGRILPQGSAAWLARLGTFPRWPTTSFDGQGSPAWSRHVADQLISSSSTASLAVHPVQLYAVVLCLALFGCLVWLRPRLPTPGAALGVFVLGYAWIRFSLELVRGDAERGQLGPLVEGRLLLALGWLVFGLLAGYGPVSAVRNQRARFAVRLAVLVPGLCALVARTGLTAWDAFRPSSTQWIALVSATAACVGVRWRGSAPQQPAASARVSVGSQDQVTDQSEASAGAGPDSG